MILNPLVSIIIPVYGTEKYLERCLKSVIEQTYKNLEIIIVDDCSMDDSIAIIEAYMQKDERISCIRHKKNRGLFQARITGAEYANGEYITFVDSDDYICKDYYRLLIEKAVTKDFDIVAADTIFVSPDGKQTIRTLYSLCFTKEEFFGDDVRKKYYGQQGTCFSWHTVWNKIYKKTLWEKCLPYYKTITKHLIMTEDIAFSSPMMYMAESFAKTDHAYYFYCQNPKASTNSTEISCDKYCKNVGDIGMVFNMVENFLNAQNADKKIMSDFLEFRKMYSRMWRSLQEYRFKTDKKAINAINDFLPAYKKLPFQKDSFFDEIEPTWNAGIENIKNMILDNGIKYVSFDIFDTLVKRPFMDPTDIHRLMNQKFSQLMNSHINIPFEIIRRRAEVQARSNLRMNGNGQDVTLTEIYEAMSKYFDIPMDVAMKLRDEENELEIRFCTQRKTAKEIYDFVKSCGKKIIITSDMYLELDTIKKILTINSYDGYEHLFLSSNERCLKVSGLFDVVVKTLRVKPENILHIGDTWNSDILPPQKVGIKSCFFPKARESFENKINGIKTNDCSNIENIMAAPNAKQTSPVSSLGYRCMRAIVSNKFFDNPYTTFEEKSDFNGNPKMIGYYLMGMHCYAICDWLAKNALKNGHKKIYFLARDGYLPKKAFDLYIKAHNIDIKTGYLYASRKLTLPFMINSKIDLYDLPVEKNNHSPRTLIKLLSFCSKYNNLDEIQQNIKLVPFSSDSKLSDEKDMFAFITWFIQNCYDEKKLNIAKEKLRKYYSVLCEDDCATFDMGYSGRIQAAISAACEKGVDAYFVFKETQRCSFLQNKYGFRCETMYPYPCQNSSIMREYLLSDSEPACIGLDDSINPIFDEEKKDYQEKFIINTLQNSAIEFMNDVLSIFSGYYDLFDISPVECSYPFEYYLTFAKHMDRLIFKAVDFEDLCYGNMRKISAFDIFNNQICEVKTLKCASDDITRNMVELKPVTGDANEDDEIIEDTEADEIILDKTSDEQQIAAMFLDIIKPDDTINDKFAKCTNNTGNIVRCEAIRKTVSPQIIPNWKITSNDEITDFPSVFVTLNLAYIHKDEDFTYMSKILKRIKDKPIVPITVGFDIEDETHIKSFSFHKDSLKVLEEIADRCKSIGVRGEYSADILEKNGIKNLDIIGSPALYVNTDKTKAISNNNKPSSVMCSFKPFYNVLSTNEKKLLKYFYDNKFDLFAQTKLCLTNENIKEQKLFDLIKPWEIKSKTFFNIFDWKTGAENYDFAMGMEFYTNVVAMYAGVPALFISRDIASKEMCKFFDLPSINISAFDDRKPVESYYKLADYSNFKSTIEKKLLAYNDFLEKNSISFKKSTSRIIEV